MVCSCRFCGGLILDVKRKLPFFASDFYDALHIQALSTILFIYLGTVTNAITFGGLLGDATENMQVFLPVWVPPARPNFHRCVKAAEPKPQRCHQPVAGCASLGGAEGVVASAAKPC